MMIKVILWKMKKYLEKLLMKKLSNGQLKIR